MGEACERKALKLVTEGMHGKHWGQPGPAVALRGTVLAEDACQSTPSKSRALPGPYLPRVHLQAGTNPKCGTILFAPADPRTQAATLARLHMDLHAHLLQAALHLWSKCGRPWSLSL